MPWSSTGSSSPWWRPATLLVGAGLVAAAAAAVAQRAVDVGVRRLPARGVDVDVAGRSVHVQVWGSDDPTAVTVVAETGVGGTAADWEAVAGLVGDDVRLVAVDRPGLGRSASGAPPDVGGVVDRLEAVRDRFGIDGAVVVAGWSMGGLLALGAAILRPDLVGGLVLVDPSHPDEARRFDDPALHPLGQLMWHTVGVASRFGGAALAGIPSRLAYLRLSGVGHHEPRWQVPTFATADAGRALAAEMLAFPEVCDEVASLHADRPDLAGVPTILVTASDRRDEADASAWAEMHADLAAWVPGTEVVVAERSGHHVLADRPDVVADAIRLVLQAVSVGDRSTGRPPVLSPG